MAKKPPNDDNALAPEVGAAEETPAPVVAGDAVPPAPGDDADSVFERKMERLTNIVAEAEFESGTALGDMVDCILELFKARPILWAAMDSKQQRDTVRHIEAVARQILGKVVLVIAQGETPTIEGTLLAQFGIKGDAVEAKIKIDHIDGESLIDVYNLAGHRIVLISADDKRFSSKRRDPDTPGNQAELQFADAQPKGPKEIVSEPPSHPDDDSDLADEEEVADTPEELDPDKLYGVFDSSDGAWLIDEDGGDDGWTANAKDAGRWPPDKARELAAAFESEPGALTVKAAPDDASEGSEG